MYIPYNAYKVNAPNLKYADMLDKGSVKSDLQRYELHRVWVVEATLKPGMSHVEAKRVYYLDEDSHVIALTDSYDGRGNLWRSKSFHLYMAYDATVMMQGPSVYNDLVNGNYLVNHLINERKAPVYTWGHKAKVEEFQVGEIRRRGTR
jgi:hypothetical protein